MSGLDPPAILIGTDSYLTFDLCHVQPQEQFIEPLTDITCKEKDKSVAISCKYSKPTAAIRWYKNKLEIFQGQKYNFHNQEGDLVLTISHVGMEDAGRYTCQADDKKTTATITVTQKLVVHYFTQKLPNPAKVKRKRDMVLECMISDPTPHVDWFKDGKPIEVRDQVRFIP